MCGIAGILDCSGRRPIVPGLLRRMADAIVHRGPDEDGYFEAPGIGLANRRLSIVGLADGRQPITNEDGSVVVVFNGELFDYPEVKARLEAKGHRFATHCDTELIPHLWEEYQEGMFTHLQGQFALALWDRRRDVVILARDRFGICPLAYSRQCWEGGEWLLFGSEVKALLASGLVPARPDLRGLDQVFNFLAVPGPATCFDKVSYLPPGSYLKMQFRPDASAEITIQPYWRISFPNAGEEERVQDPRHLVAEFERVLLGAVERRLRADVPVVSYLSGGIDSSIVVAMAAKIRGTPIPTFTIQIRHPRLDETSQAAVTSRHIGSVPIVVSVGDEEILGTYPELIRAAEIPVIDTSCTALLLLAKAVHQRGFKVALTGEGSDEWLAGYIWNKINKALNGLDIFPAYPIGHWLRKVGFRVMGASSESLDYIHKIEQTLGHHSAFQEFYGLLSLSRQRFFSAETLEQLADYSPYLELEPDLAEMSRWHSQNQSQYWASRIHLPGHLLSSKGDRVAMNSSVETRYPFLDSEVHDFLARISPDWKLRGMREKYLLRLLGERYLPEEVAWRRKGMFRAPLDSFFDHKVPSFVDQLLSPESLRKTGYFNVASVRYWSDQVRQRRLSMRKKTAIELGLVGVVATQLWHHTFIDSSLADIPSNPTPIPLLATA